MVDKDHDKDKHEAAKREADKHEADKREAEKRDAGKHAAAPHVDNISQDPNHPANKTPSKDMRPLAERDRIDGPVFTSENLRTEQEKDVDNESMGVGPVTPSAASPGPVLTVEEQGIGPRTPYPTGNPPPPVESVSYSQGIKGQTDKPRAEPSAASGPAGRAPGVDDRNAAYKANQRETHR